MRPIPAVEAHELRKSFPTPGGRPIEILHGVTCAIESGRMTALVGPSGSGKSTALLCLAGLEPASSGRVTVIRCTRQTSTRAAAKASTISVPDQARH